jgi:hypothetical protein
MSTIPPVDLGRPVVYVLKSNDGAKVYDPRHNRFLYLNTTGLEMWAQLNGGKSENDVVTGMAEKYCVPESIIASDLRMLIRMVEQHDLTIDGVLLIAKTEVADEIAPSASFPSYIPAIAKRNSKPTRLTILRALLGLVLFDLILSLSSFHTLCSCIRRCPMSRRAPEDKDKTPAMTEVCAAVDQACIWYPRKAVCLQRSAVTTFLLRREGIPAHMVIGIHPLPFSAHAWVEADNEVINDFPAVRRFYQSLTSY